MKKRNYFLALLLAFGLFTSTINADSITDWNGFGGNERNNKITYAKTPSSASDIDIVKKISSTSHVMDPIIINDKMYAISNLYLTEFNKDGSETGRKLSLGSVGYFSKIAHGDGKIFIAAANSIIAVDLISFQKVWQSNPINNVQALSAITYYNGYIYSGYTITPTADGTPSSGFFFALSTVDENPASSTEIKDYTWTYPIDEADHAGSGYYWTDAAIVNSAIVFAGDNGLVISHHLTKNIVYDKYQLSASSNIKKVRSTIIFDEQEDAIFVGTQDSKEFYKIKMFGHTFDRTAIKSTNEIAPLSGGFAIGSTNIYLSSGGMSGKNITVLDKDLNLVGTNVDYGTQSIPLVSEGVDNNTYVYFMEYATGKLLIGKDLNDGSMITFSEYKEAPMDTYNSFSIIPFFDGTLVIPYNGFSTGGFVLIKSKATINTSDIETIIDKTDNLTDYVYHERIAEVEKRVADFKAANPSETISNDAKLAANKAIQEADITAKIAKANVWPSQTDLVALESQIAIGSKLPNPISNWNRLLNFLDRSWLGFVEINLTTAIVDKNFNDASLKNSSTVLKNTIANDTLKALRYKAIIEFYNDNIYKNASEVTAGEIKVNMDQITLLLKSEENKETFTALDDKANALPEIITLKDKAVIDAFTNLLKTLEQEAQTAYKKLNPSLFDKYEAALADFTKQKDIVDALNDAIAAVDPLTISYADKATITKIISDYEALSIENKPFISDWYANILDAKLEIAKQEAAINSINADIAKVDVKRITYADKAFIEGLIKRYNALTKEQKAYVSVHYQNVLAAKKIIDSITAYSETKGNVTYTYKKVNNTWYLVTTVIKTNTSQQTTSYNTNGKIIKVVKEEKNTKGQYIKTYVNTKLYYANNVLKTDATTTHSLTTGVVTKKVTTSYDTKGKLAKQQTIFYNEKGKLIKNVIIQKNAKNKNVMTYSNVIKYYKNNKIQTNSKVYRDLKTGKFTKKQVITYHANSKKKRDITATYKAGKLSVVKDYRFNKQGQLKSNKYGKAYYIQKNYKNGKLQKTLKYQYDAKGKKVKI